MRGFLPFEGHIHKANGLQSQHLTPMEGGGKGERREGVCRWEGGGGGRRGWISPGNKSVDAPLSPDTLPRRGFLFGSGRERVASAQMCPRCGKPVEADFSFRLSCLPNDFCFTAQLDCVH